VRLRCTEIVWDTDGEDVDLPTETVVEVDDDCGDEQPADALSDKYGWCVQSVNRLSGPDEIDYIVTVSKGK